MNDKQAEWKDIAGYEGVYQISSDGNVKSFYKDGWHTFKSLMIVFVCLSIVLYKSGISRCFLVHRLVMFSFAKIIKNKSFVNHKNGIKIDNRINNLEWVDRSENAIHYFDALGKISAMTGRYGSLNNGAKPIAQLNSDGSIIKKWGSLKEASTEIGVSPSVIWKILNNKKKTKSRFIFKYLNK